MVGTMCRKLLTGIEETKLVRSKWDVVVFLLVRLELLAEAEAGLAKVKVFTFGAADAEGVCLEGLCAAVAVEGVGARGWSDRVLLGKWVLVAGSWQGLVAEAFPKPLEGETSGSGVNVAAVYLLGEKGEVYIGMRGACKGEFGGKRSMVRKGWEVSGALDFIGADGGVDLWRFVFWGVDENGGLIIEAGVFLQHL